MMQEKLNLAEYKEGDVFNLLHDLHQEVSLNDMQKRNKIYFPKVRISKAGATPNDTFISKKNIIMVGAGSGISPYLPLLEEVIRIDQGKSHMYNFDSARLIFIAREGEQISWVSNYLFHIISSKCVIPTLKFDIYITLEKNVKTLPSFLFWRAFLLIGLSKQICGRSKQLVMPSFKYDQTNTFIEKLNEEECPVKVMFGRPDFKAIFESGAEGSAKSFYVYTTTSPQLNQHIFEATLEVSRETGVKFHHIYESTS